MIFFFHGPDTFRSRQKLREIREKFRRDIDPSNLNCEVLDGEKLEPADFEKAVSTPAFLAKKRLIVVENLLTKNKSQKTQKEILEILDKSPLADTVLVFWEGALSGGRAKKTKAKAGVKKPTVLLGRLAAEKYAQEFKLLQPSEVSRWAGMEIKNRGGKIQPAALQLLSALVGNDLWQLSGEVDKLIAAADGGEITAADVKESVKTKLDEDIFKLTDALAARHKPLALKLISDQLQSGTAPVELLNKITWQFKNLLLIKSFTEANGAYPPDRLAFQLGLHPYVVKKTAALVRNYQLTGLKKIYRDLLAIDYKIKTSQIHPEILFDLLIVKN